MAGVRGRPRQFDREAALDAAMRLFWECGYEGTSIDTLSAEMEINRPSLYGSFGSKEQLFREAVERYSQVEGEPIERAMSEAPNTRSAVEAFLRTNAVAYASDSKPGGCMIVLSALAGTPESRDVRAFLSEIRKDDQVFLEERLKAGQDSGELDGEVDVESLARFYITVLQGLSIQARDGATLKQMNSVISVAMIAWPAKARSVQSIAKSSARVKMRASRKRAGA